MNDQQVTIFGANGRVGSLVVQEALARGYKVVAFVHRAGAMTDTDRLRIIEGDIYDAHSVATAIDGSQFVISALGSWGTPRKDILSAGAHTIIPAMHANKIRRIISLTGADARAQGDRTGFIHRLTHIVFSITAGKILKDGEYHLSTLLTSGLDWTVIRSPIMKDTSLHTTYQLTAIRPMPWATIDRSLVAKSMVDQLTDDSWLQKSPFISAR